MRRGLRSVVTVLLAIALGAACARGPSPLGGTWTVASLPVVGNVDRTEAPQVQFTVGGRVQGTTGCADFSAPFTVVGAHFAIGAVESSGDPQPCAERERLIERVFVEALRAGGTLTGGRPSETLTISGPQGDLVMSQPSTAGQ